MLYAIVATIFLIADQWLKYWVTVNITLATGEAAFLPGVVKLVNIHNDGAAFSVLAGLSFARWLFLGLAALFVVLIIIMLARHIFPSKFVTWCGVMAMTGAIGNCIDRLLYGYVVDMFKLEFVTFAVFNVADVILVLSCLSFIIFLIVDAIRGGNKAPAETPNVNNSSNIEVAGIKSDAPDFPETAAPIMGESNYTTEDELWNSFKEDLHQNKRTRATAEFASQSEPVSANQRNTASYSSPESRDFVPKPQPKPEVKQAPKEEIYNLEDILAEFR